MKKDRLPLQAGRYVAAIVAAYSFLTPNPCMLDSIFSISYGYNLICTVITVTGLALLCLPFTVSSIGEKLGMALHLLISGAGLTYGLFYLFDLTFCEQQLMGYCFFCGLAAIICTFLLRPFSISIPLCIVGSSSGCICLAAWCAGLLIGGSIVCPYLWIAGIFWVLARLYARIGNGNNIITIIAVIIGGSTVISVTNIFFSSNTLNIFSSVINQYIINNVVHKSNQVTRLGDNLEKSTLTLSGDLSRKTISKTTIFGSSEGLPELTAHADECSAMQFLIAVDVKAQGYSSQGTRNYQTSWTIRSCNTGDSDAETYIRTGYGSPARLTETPVTINGQATLEIQTKDKTITTLRLSENKGYSSYSRY